MEHAASAVLTPWSNFYIMTGSSASALTGLMFVVITIVTGAQKTTRSRYGVSIFSTPTVVHFCEALLLSAILSAPWQSLGHAALVLGGAGFYGLAYMTTVAYRSTKLRTYEPDVEDRIWYGILPFVGYAAIVAGAVALVIVPVTAMFGLAAGVAFLILVGIRNAWDVVTYIAIDDEDPPAPS